MTEHRTRLETNPDLSSLVQLEDGTEFVMRELYLVESDTDEDEDEDIYDAGESL